MTTGHERDDHQYTNLLLAAQAALTTAEKATFLGRFPSMKGAKVAEVLEQVEDADLSFGFIAPMLKAHGHEVPEPHLLSVATQLCLGLHGATEVTTWEIVRAMVERIRPLLGMTTWQLAQVQAQQLDDEAKAAKLVELEPLGFEDADDGEAPHHIYHPSFGSIDHRAVNLGTVVQQAFNEGRMAGRNELRAELHALLKHE